MSLSLLSNMWNNKGEVLDGLLSSFTNPTQEVELGDDWDRGAAAHNIPVDVGNIAKDIKTIVSHPKESFDAATGLIGGAWRLGLEKVMPEGVMDALGKVDEFVGYDSEPDKAMASEAWKGIVATHGGLEELQKYGNEHPVYLAAELSGLGFLARQVTKMVAPAVVKAMEATEMGVSRGLLAVENVAESVESAFPQPLGTQIFAGDVAKGTGFNVAKYGERDVAKAKAEQMVKDGGINYENLSNIWDETGHFVTPSGKVLWEIDDSAMKFTPTEGYASMLYDNRNVRVGDDMGSMKLIDMVDHPQLYENYPRLKDAKIVFVKGKTTDGYAHDTRGALGSYHVGDNTVRVMVDPKIGLTPKSKEIIVHEIQHGIQTIEAIPGGASNSAQYWDVMDTFFKKELDNLTKLDQSTTWLYDERVFNVEGKPYYGQPSLNQRDPEWLAARIKQLKKYRSDIKDVGVFDPSMTPMALAKQTKKREALYYRTEGEWMARITEGRKKLENEDSLLNTDFPLPKGWREKTSPLEQADTGTSDYTLMTGRHKSNYDKALKQFYEKDVISQGDYLTSEIRKHAGINVKNLKTGLLDDALPWRTGGKEGDLYITRVGTNAGTVSKTRTSANDIAINFDQNQLLPDYAYYLLMHLQPKINARAHGTAQQAIKKSDIDDILMEYFTEGK